MLKNWVIREPKHDDLLQDLIASRDVTVDLDYDSQLHDPFLMKDMIRAVERVKAAVAAGEKIVIFGDYDADGVPGAAVIAEFFRQIKYENFSVYLPDRHNEQYGLSVAIVEKLAKAGANLIITVDCGIVNVAEVELANKLGIDVIVTDHHLVGETLPPAYAILNPKQADCAYPYKMLCGAGVAFKLVQALAVSDFFRTFGKNPQVAQKITDSQAPASGGFSNGLGIVSEDLRKVSRGAWEKWLLDLVAIATISDMVPLDGENRLLAFYGLKVLRKTRRVGLLHLYRKLNLRSEYLTEDDVAFLIGPRINTASRMAHADLAYQLLMTTDPVTAEVVAEELEEKNKERRSSVDSIIDHLGAALVGEPPAVIVAGHEDWSLGVLGLSASRVLEKYNRIVFLWGKNGQGEIRGSCRSDGSVSVVELMAAANAGEQPLFSNYGGHLHAGGFVLATEMLPKLGERLASALEVTTRQEVAPDIIIDRELDLTRVTESLVKQLEKLAPFGIGNPKPTFLFRRARLTQIRYFGSTSSHLELTLESASSKTIKAISFFNVFPELNLISGQDVDLVATVEKSYFRGRPELRLRIVDLRSAR